MSNVSISINAGTPDSFQSSPRAVIAIFPFIVREIFPQITINQVKSDLSYQDYLNLRNNVIIITDDVLSVSVNTAKGGPNHTLQASIAPLDGSSQRPKGKTSTSTAESNIVNYLQRIAPGDYVMSWIVNGTEELETLQSKLRLLEPCNEYNSGLKFVGQVMNIQESFRTSTNGIKSKRYSLSAAGFNQYNSQIYYSPFITPQEGKPAGAELFVENFYNTLGDNVVDRLYSAQDGDPLNIHKQFKALHKLLLGVGPGSTSESNPIKSVNGAFGVPFELSKVLGRQRPQTSSASFATFADLMSVLIGVWKFKSNASDILGPDFELESSVQFKGGSFGAYYEPAGDGKEKYFLKGKKNLAISPTMGGTVYSLLQQVSNTAINEMYFTLRSEPKENGDILPTLVCRQFPYVTKLIEELNDFTFTNFMDMPRFMIPNESIIAYDISRSEALRLNAAMVRMNNSIPQPHAQEFLDAIALQFGNWAYDSNDIKRHGMRFHPVQVDQDTIALDNAKRSLIIRNYTTFISSVISNQHLKYTGNLQTVGIFEPICIGDNLEFNNIVFQIEGVSHNYQVQAGMPTFRTTLSMSHGIHKSGKLDALQIPANYQDFLNMHEGIVKDSKYPTEFLGTEKTPSRDERDQPKTTAQPKSNKDQI